MIQKKTHFDLNIDDIFNCEQKKVNKQLIRTITSKFHQLFLKYVNEIRVLKTENESLKPKKTSSFHNTPKKKMMVPVNIGNLSLADLNTEAAHDRDVSIEKEISIGNEDVLSQLKEDEVECFNQILADFYLQINDLETKEDSLRHDISLKIDKINKLNIELDDLKNNKMFILQELQSMNYRMAEYKVNPNPITTHTDETSSKKEDVFGSNLNFEEFSGKSKRYDVISKLREENKHYKDMILKMKDDSFKIENEVTELYTEVENFENFKKFILNKNKELDKKVKEFQQTVDELNHKITQISFIFDENDMLN